MAPASPGTLRMGLLAHLLPIRVPLPLQVCGQRPECMGFLAWQSARLALMSMAAPSAAHVNAAAGCRATEPRTHRPLLSPTLRQQRPLRVKRQLSSFLQVTKAWQTHFGAAKTERKMCLDS